MSRYATKSPIVVAAGMASRAVASCVNVPDLLGQVGLSATLIRARRDGISDTPPKRRRQAFLRRGAEGTRTASVALVSLEVWTSGLSPHRPGTPAKSGCAACTLPDP
jgi:hypothetical protein